MYIVSLQLQLHVVGLEPGKKIEFMMLYHSPYHIRFREKQAYIMAILIHHGLLKFYFGIYWRP